jgi:hypothetical protein
MQTAILPDVDKIVIGSPHGKLTTKQLALEDVAIRQVLSARDRMPEIRQTFTHRLKSLEARHK